MVLSRIRQGLTYIFSKYDKEKNDFIVKQILSEDEFKIFNNMSNYDKVHSFSVFNKVKKSRILFDKKIYLKLALLHDCGKGNIGLFRRIKKVLIGDKKLNKHEQLSYFLLKDINLELANLALIHHQKNVDEYMKEFQKIDDK